MSLSKSFRRQASGRAAILNLILSPVAAHTGAGVFQKRAASQAAALAQHADMHTRRASRTSAGQPADYEIKVRGAVDERWSEWFGGLTVAAEADDRPTPITTLTGRVPDQAALRGILNKLWDLNLTLISVAPVATAPQAETRHDH